MHIHECIDRIVLISPLFFAKGPFLGEIILGPIRRRSQRHRWGLTTGRLHVHVLCVTATGAGMNWLLQSHTNGHVPRYGWLTSLHPRASCSLARRPDNRQVRRTLPPTHGRFSLPRTAGWAAPRARGSGASAAARIRGTRAHAGAECRLSTSSRWLGLLNGRDSSSTQMPLSFCPAMAHAS